MFRVLKMLPRPHFASQGFSFHEPHSQSFFTTAAQALVVEEGLHVLSSVSPPIQYAPVPWPKDSILRCRLVTPSH